MDDRISGLTDDILSIILTMLSMKDLLKTSILSRRWCKLWTLRRDFYFDIFNVLGSEKRLLEKGYLIHVLNTFTIPHTTLKRVNLDKSTPHLVKRVDQFVMNFQGTTITSFHVNFYLDCEHSDTIDRWISFAIERGVARMNLLFLGNQHPYIHSLTLHDRYRFDFASFSKTNLSTLNHLCLQNCLVCHPINFDFIPFKILKSLSLDSAKLDETFVESLLSNCPQLEELCLVSCEFKSSMPRIVSSSLCHLKVISCYLAFDDYKERVGLFLVDCLKLTSLETNGFELDILSIHTPKLKSAEFTILFKQDPTTFFALCATFPELEILHVDIFPMVRSPLEITQPFKHLKQLNLLLFVDSYMLDDVGYDLFWILNILQACPLLQKLSIMFLSPEFFENQKDIRDVEILSHGDIKVIELGGCFGNWYEIEFVKNVLKYAYNLEQIVLSPYWTEDGGESWMYDPMWFENGCERMREKLKGEEVVGREKLVFIEDQTLYGGKGISRARSGSVIGLLGN